MFIVESTMQDAISADIEVTNGSNAFMQVHLESKRLVWHKKCFSLFRFTL